MASMNVLDDRISMILNTLAKSAAREICNLVQDSYAALFTQVSKNKDEEIERLKMRLAVAEEWKMLKIRESEPPSPQSPLTDSPPAKPLQSDDEEETKFKVQSTVDSIQCLLGPGPSTGPTLASNTRVLPPVVSDIRKTTENCQLQDPCHFETDFVIYKCNQTCKDFSHYHGYYKDPPRTPKPAVVERPEEVLAPQSHSTSTSSPPPPPPLPPPAQQPSCDVKEETSLKPGEGMAAVHRTQERADAGTRRRRPTRVTSRNLQRLTARALQLKPEPPAKKRRQCQVARCAGNKTLKVCANCKRLVCGKCSKIFPPICVDC